MIAAAELAGLFAAHAVWCVSTVETLTPILAYTTPSGGRQFERLALNELSAAAEFGRRKLESNEMDAVDAALVVDAFITLGSVRMDALVIEMRAYFAPMARATIAVPYTPKKLLQRFRVHRPKVLQWENCDDFDQHEALTAFFRGVSQHQKGAPIWNKALDESR
jgi:hypothetical protein